MSQKVTDFPIAECPVCPGKKRPINGIGFILKGPAMFRECLTFDRYLIHEKYRKVVDQIEDSKKRW